MARSVFWVNLQQKPNRSNQPGTQIFTKISRGLMLRDLLVKFLFLENSLLSRAFNFKLKDTLSGV
jgi:hypothetical protein